MNTAAIGVLVLALGAFAGESSRDGDPFLTGGGRIVFFGDSITQDGRYVRDVEAYLLTRFPDKSFDVVNHGISSETISGTSEPDHFPRRPWALERFDRDVAAWKPDVVVACFGMNDGNYHPFEEERLHKFQEGVNRLIDRVKSSTSARLVLLTPPPFDPYRRQVGDPNALHFGYKFPAVDYDHTLEKYSEWLLTLRTRGVVVADVHSAMNAHLARLRKEKVSAFLAGDAVHPGASGHLLMAETLLSAWHAPMHEAVVRIDAGRDKQDDARVTEFERTGGGFTAVVMMPLPIPIDPDVDAASRAIGDFESKSGRTRIVFGGLTEGRYELLAAEAPEKPIRLGEFDAGALGRGVDVSGIRDFPTARAAGALGAELTRVRRAEYDAWRRRIAADPETIPAEPPPRTDRAALREAARPRAIRLEVRPR